MADVRVTYLERRAGSDAIEEVDVEEFEENSSPQAAHRALEAAEAWVVPDRRNRSYRLERLLPPD